MDDQRIQANFEGLAELIDDLGGRLAAVSAFIPFVVSGAGYDEAALVRLAREIAPAKSTQFPDESPADIGARKVREILETARHYSGGG